MVGHVGLHRTDHRDVVDALADVGKDLADFDPALSVALELEGRPHDGPGSAFGDQVHALGELLAVVFVEGRFGVERIDVGRTAAQEQVNHALGLGGKVWLPRRQRGVEAAGRACRVPERIAPSRLTSASAPMPMPPRQSKSRRVRKTVFPSWLVRAHRFLHRGRKLCGSQREESRGKRRTRPGGDLVTRPGRMAFRASLSIASSGRP